ncbi:hypothetical protein CAQU_02280 [Corynebacterium aquilae DSM 44791]|uniref:Uncharacterized protein n=1 Tax=Corynebacterium aquilae DSM 44791 TaxID=1431546 RepID=A0A1L7CE02_9CORY|nr:hypothetical protein CAQU_02280 [Corynebacterium aquilae DSM 44791]
MDTTTTKTHARPGGHRVFPAPTKINPAPNHRTPVWGAGFRHHNRPSPHRRMKPKPHCKHQGRTKSQETTAA